MKNLIKLIKINLLTLFNFYKIKNAKTKQEKSKESRKFLLIIIAFGYLGWFIFKFASTTIVGLKTLNLTNVLLPAFMSIASSYLLFTTIYKVNKTLFNSKDYSILLSLPIKKTTIISSKIIYLYILNLIYACLFMIPTYIAYIMNIDTKIMFHFVYFISLIFIPFVPTVIGSIVGSILTGISSKFKHKNFVNIFISIIFFILVMLFSYRSGSMDSIDLANMSNALFKTFNKIYPLTLIYSKLIIGKILYLLLFIIISIGIYELFKYLVVLFFDKINSNLSGVTIINKYNDKKNKQHNVIFSLYKKELKRFFSSSTYVMNTSIGSIMLTLAIIAFIIMGPKKLEAMLEINGLKNMLTFYAPLVFSLSCALSCTTYPSVSLEGKNLWILKQLPIKTSDIFISKILLNLSITIPFIIINSILLTIYLKLSITSLILMIITPVLFTIFIAGYGLLINILFPDFEWTSEVKVIKQSIASIITIFTGLILSIIPLMLKTNLKPNIYSLVICLIIFLINIILYIILYTIGKRKFERL